MRAGRLALASLALATAPSAAPAQVVRPVLRPSMVVAERPFDEPTSLLTAPQSRGREARRAAWRPRFSTPASVVGGAVVGAWLGYFLSQVVKSDWEGMRGGERAVHRRQFAFSGAAVGAIAGYLVRPRPRAPGVREPEPAYVYIARSPRHYITRSELRRAPVLSALEAVQTLRPEWLEATYGGQTGARHSSSRPAPSDTAVAVYVVDTRLPGPGALAEISIPELEELRLYEPAEAQRRWGTAHPRGAIEVVPATDRSPR